MVRWLRTEEQKRDRPTYSGRLSTGTTTHTHTSLRDTRKTPSPTLSMFIRQCLLISLPSVVFQLLFAQVLQLHQIIYLCCLLRNMELLLKLWWLSQLISYNKNSCSEGNYRNVWVKWIRSSSICSNFKI